MILKKGLLTELEKNYKKKFSEKQYFFFFFLGGGGGGVVWPVLHG